MRLLSLVVMFGLLVSCSGDVSGPQFVIEEINGVSIFPIENASYQSILNLVEAGRYDIVDEDILDPGFQSYPKYQPPIQLLDKSNLQIVRLNQGILYNDAVHALRELGFRPANYKELLVFGATYPKLQKRFSILALGSLLGQKTPYLAASEYGRSINVRWFGLGLHSGHCLLVVQE